MSQAISNLFGTSYTPGRAWDPSMGPEEEFNPNVPHDPTALATGRSGGGTFMPVQIGTTGAAKPALGIQTDPNVFPDPEERANITGGMNLTGESSKTADTGDIEKNKMLQRDLNSMGAQLAVDGIIGPKTKAAMEQAHLGAQGTSDTPSAVGTSPGSALPPQITHNMGPMSATPVGTTETQPPAATATTDASPAAPTGSGLQEPTDAAGLEKLINVGGRGIDWLHDVFSGLVGDAVNIGDEFVSRANPEREARIAERNAEMQRNRDAYSGNIGTEIYNTNWGDLANRAGNQVSSLFDELTARYNSPNAYPNIGDRYEDTVYVDMPPPATLGEVADTPLPAAATAPIREAAPENTDRLKAATRTHGGITSAQPVTDEVLDAGGPVNLGNATDMPFQELVAILAPLTAPQRANMLKDMGPQMKADILAALDDYDTADDTGI